MISWLRNRQAAREAAVEAAARDQEFERLVAERDRLEEVCRICSDVEGCYDEREGSPIILKKGEHIIGMTPDTGLVEVKAGKARYQGGSQGVSIRVAKGVSYRVGGHKGTVVRDPEMPRLLCVGGTFVATTMRGVYVGPKYTREFDWVKVVSLAESVGEGGHCLLIAVTNRQKVSGVLCDDLLITHAEIGVAIATDTFQELIDAATADAEKLNNDLDALNAKEFRA